MMDVEFSCSSVNESKNLSHYFPDNEKFVRNLFEFGFLVYEFQNGKEYFSHLGLNEDEKLELFDGTFSKSQRIIDIVSLFSESDYDGIVIEFRNGESFHFKPKCDETFINTDLMVQSFLKLMLNQREDPYYIKDNCRGLSCVNYELTKKRLTHPPLDRRDFISNLNVDAPASSEYQGSINSMTDTNHSSKSNSSKNEKIVITPRDDKSDMKESCSRSSSTKSRMSLHILTNYILQHNQNGSSKSTANSCNSTGTSPCPDKHDFTTESYQSSMCIQSPKSIFSVFGAFSNSFKKSSSCKSASRDSNLSKHKILSSSAKVANCSESF